MKTDWIIVFLFDVASVYGSRGDRSNAHQECLQSCYKSNRCDSPEKVSNVLVNPKFNLLVWDCESECDYSCMWKTVSLFQEHGIKIPQFYGKWPFSRLIGMQEPASVFFSILNAVAHIYSIIQFRRWIIPKSPMYKIWHGYCLVAVNTWFWSTVFHMRDFEFTENMDYMCATSMVTYQFYSLLARLLAYKPARYNIVASLIVGGLCARHVYRMLFIHFDYGYHVKINVIVGVLNAIGWLCWGLYTYMRRRQTYVWKACTSIALVGLCLSLEVLDFPPIAWVFDAHSLWHAGTAPITLLWYSFAIDDCNYMVKYGQQDERSEKLESALHRD